MSTMSSAIVSLASKEGDGGGEHRRDPAISSMMPENENSTTPSKSLGDKARGRKRKRSSAFRVKVGCIVALRFRQGGNSIRVAPQHDPEFKTPAPGFAPQLSEVWVDPRPGHDEGLALVGSLIRCCFPRYVTSDGFEKKSRTRFLEGEVVSILDYKSQLTKQQVTRRRREACGTRVELLVDEDKLDALPFLSRNDDEKLRSNLSGSPKREFAIETRIRGEKKAIVEVVLNDQSGIVLKRDNINIEARWVIRKRVPVKKAVIEPFLPLLQPRQRSSHTDSISKVPVGTDQTNGQHYKKRKTVSMRSEIRYIGDGNDSRSQQEANWRWQSSKYTPFAHLKEKSVESTLETEWMSNFAGEVVRIHPTLSDSKSLATVTIKRIILPEHTQTGRTSRHQADEVFGDVDSCFESNGGGGGRFCLYEAPVEELVVLSRRMRRYPSPPHPSEGRETRYCQGMTLKSASSYSFRMSAYVMNGDIPALMEDPERKDLYRCSVCTKHFLKPVKERNETNGTSSDMETVQKENDEDHACGVTCNGEDKVHVLVKIVQDAINVAAKEACGSALEHEVYQRLSFSRTRCLIRRMGRGASFSLSNQFAFEELAASKPISRVKSRATKSYRRDLTKPAVNEEERVHTTIDKSLALRSTPTGAEWGCARLYKHCARESQLNNMKNLLGVPPPPFLSEDRPRNLRQSFLENNHAGDGEKIETSQKSRAARANQRRLLRDVAAIGVSFDALAGREQQLRFDRSTIHAWGVFADVDVKEGEMLVEYRGEIIGNSVAEKREKTYDAEKIGSDYMFRLDGSTVCDATKQGNVARFINASCDPNCYTKIITIEGTKRIVIYAKKDISAGEELCYDYKFPLENEESKRILCCCGFKDCRGFMNWDKRYDAQAARVAAKIDGP